MFSRRKKVAKRRMVVNTRNLHTSFGKVASDDLFYASSGMFYTTTPLYREYTTEKGALKYFNEGKALRNSSIKTNLFYGVESISSIRGPVGEKGYNNCLHKKLQTVNRPFLFLAQSPTISYYIGYAKYTRLRTTRGYPTGLGDVASAYGQRVYPGSDKLFSARAFWSMRPKFVGEVSLVNSLFELKDFKDVVNLKKQFKVWHNLNKTTQVSKAMAEFKRLRYKHNISITVNPDRAVLAPYDLSLSTLKTLARDVSGAAANAVLTMNLAIKPTIADVLAIRAAMLTTADAAQKEFAEYGETGSSSHYSEQDVYQSLTYGTGGYYYKAEGRQTVVKQTASMRSYYDYKLRTANQALLKYWGLTGTTEALWNMLPLSFILDYVYTVGKALKFMYRDENVTNLTTEYCESVKVSVTDGLHVALDPRIHAFVYDGKYYPRQTKKESLLVSGTECIRYNRRVVEPYKGPALPKFKMPSTSQAVNLLALCRSFLS